MPPRLHQKADDGRFAQLSACFQPVQPFHQDETVAVAPHQDRRLLTVPLNALRDLVDVFWIKGGSSLGRHVNPRDRKRFTLHHVETSLAITAKAGST
jgi:hypothetical protein